ncbi:TNF receptor-associated factor 6-like isoform X2 [Helianthus annuus]|uniref:TNF receptor-associated factor 6-like isoform X2 n=1 Tax=Helianthus annuus TaxID=4232 RepID=UPI0016530999|nr:TNF receptor-associated factor 6-like isoform X2 [Helianthus annuus]XP_035834508.1 TNF receptor-associated factor 6-like isoform X2 [Helianthus annuus]
MIYFPLGASSSMPPTFECPICMGPLVEQMATRCGHMFCEGCIRDIQVGKCCKVFNRCITDWKLSNPYYPSHVLLSR